jgi:hypothetical protein
VAKDVTSSTTICFLLWLSSNGMKCGKETYCVSLSIYKNLVKFYLYSLDDLDDFVDFYIEKWLLY